MKTTVEAAPRWLWSCRCGDDFGALSADFGSFFGGVRALFFGMTTGEKNAV